MVLAFCRCRVVILFLVVYLWLLLINVRTKYQLKIDTIIEDWYVELGMRYIDCELWIISNFSTSLHIHIIRLI